jgi:hypothetical protein
MRELAEAVLAFQVGSVLIFLIVLGVGFFLVASLTRHQSAATRSHEAGSTAFPSRSPGDHGRLDLARQRRSVVINTEEKATRWRTSS